LKYFELRSLEFRRIGAFEDARRGVKDVAEGFHFSKVGENC